MNTPNDSIDSLTEQLISLFWNGDLRDARIVAESLARLLGEPTAEKTARYTEAWIVINEVRGNVEEAIRIAELDNLRRIAEFDAGDYDPYPELHDEMVDYLLKGLFLQADRYAR